MPMIMMNGRPVAPGELRALGLYNYGHFTSMRVEKGMLVRGLELRMERLARDSIKLFGIGADVVRVRTLAREMAERKQSRGQAEHGTTGDQVESWE